MCSKRRISQAGFTLVEVSIVVAIIGLIIGGILLGSTLMHNARLISVTTDVDKYRKAALAYRDKYGELPGDHSTASSITSLDAGCPNPTPSKDRNTATCNGNGNSFIGSPTGSPCVDDSSGVNIVETLSVWQHMANAGFLEGRYNGRLADATTHIIPGVNVPLSEIENASFMMTHIARDTTNCIHNNANSGHVLYFGAPNFTDARINYLLPVLSTSDAKSIDLKIDDGYPSMGKVAAKTTVHMPGCSNGASFGSIYISGSSDTTPYCSLIFFLGF